MSKASRPRTAVEAVRFVAAYNGFETSHGLSLLEKLAAARERARAVGRSVRFTVDVYVTPKGQASISSVEPIADEADPVSSEQATSRSQLGRALAAVRERGQSRVADILSAEDMLTADQLARLLGTTRMTINTKRRKRQLLALEGAKRGFRFPRSQIGEGSQPFAELPDLFDRLGAALGRFIAFWSSVMRNSAA